MNVIQKSSVNDVRSGEKKILRSIKLARKIGMIGTLKPYYDMLAELDSCGSMELHMSNTIECLLNKATFVRYVSNLHQKASVSQLTTVIRLKRLGLSCVILVTECSARLMTIPQSFVQQQTT